MSNESCHLDLVAAARNCNGYLQKKTIRKCFRQHTRGILGALGHFEEIVSVLVDCAKMEEKDFIGNMVVYVVVPRSAAVDGCRVIRIRWVTSQHGVR